jgi:crotonobetainyl-CoA:carnitine CoA-transferase CaiB-like acyl-CoA transferase
VIAPEEVLTNDQLIAREMIVEVHDEARGDYKMIGCPIKMDDSPPEVTPAPRYSEHTDAILSEMLNVSDAELSDLRADGVIV